MYKKVFLFIFLILNIILFKFLLFSEDIIGIDKIFNLFLNISSIIIFILYLFNKLKSKTLLSLGFFLSFYGILSISSLVAGYIIYFLKNIINDKEIFSYYIILNTLIEAVLVFNIYFLFYKETINNQFKNFKRDNINFYNYIILFYLIAFVSNVFFSYLANLIPLSDTIPANQEGIELIINNLPNKYFYIFNLVLLGPLIEEFFFRYILIEEILFKIIKRNNLIKKMVIIILSGLIFSLFHAIAAESFIYFIRDMFLYIGTSLALSLAYVKTKNIFVGYFVHVLNNLIAVIIMLNIK